MRIPDPITLVLTLAVVLAGCSAPTPEPDEPLEPQAAAVVDAPGELRAAIEEPLDKAKAVEATQAADEAERQQALEEAGG